VGKSRTKGQMLNVGRGGQGRKKEGDLDTK